MQTRTRQGFTLLEVTVVMIIAAVLLALVGPRFAGQRDRVAVVAAAGELGSIFSNARQMAIARRTMVAVVVDTAGGSIEVHSRGRRISRRNFLAAYGTVVSANRDSAVYDARGLGYGASNMTLALRRGSIVDTLTMSRLGRVRW